MKQTIGKCEKCGQVALMTKDHIIPKWAYKRSNFFEIEGFTKNLGRRNIQNLCSVCNSKKSGFIDVSHSLGKEFWERVADTIKIKLMDQDIKEKTPD